MSAIEFLAAPLRHGFMQHAMLAIVIVGVICGVIGTFVTLRGLAFMGDALAHAIFPGVVIAFVMGGSYLVGALIAATIVSLGIGLVSQSGRLSNDTAIGVLFAGAFALGVAIISAQRTYARDVTTFLFGSILGVRRDDLLLSAAIGLLVLLAMLQFRRELVTVAFDRTFAGSLGMNLWGWDQLFLLLLSLAIVVSLQTVGNILVLAMLVTPAATARLLTDRLPTTIALAAAIGALSGAAGLYVSYYAGVASGASVVLVATALFALALLFSPKAGLRTTRVARRLHFPHPERDAFPDDAAQPDSDGGTAGPPHWARSEAGMKVAYVFSTSGHTASYKLGKMILPQLEAGNHGAEVVGMMFFDDNTYFLRAGDPMGERLAKVAKEQGILLMMCDQCAIERGLAEGQPGAVPSTVSCVGTVDGVHVGCFPDLYAALSGNPPDQVITL